MAEVREDKQESQGDTSDAALLRLLVDNIPDLAWAKDPGGVYIAANQILARTLGLADAGDIIGKTDFDISPRDLAEQYREDDRAVIASGEPIRRDELQWRVGGERFWVETIKQPLRDAGGRIIGTVGTARDVSERKATEEALRETKVRLEAIIANSRLTCFRSTYGTDGRRRKIEFFSCFTITGFSAEEINNMPLDRWALLIHPDDRQREVEEIGRLLLERNFIEHEARVTAPGGGYRHVLVRETVIARRDDEIVSEGLTVDITERKEHAASLERLNRVLQVMSEGNEALTRATSEHELCSRMCDVLVRIGGYCLAWIGFVEHDKEGTIRPVAWAGEETEFVKGLRLSWREDVRWGLGTAGRSVRTGLPQVLNDIQGDPVMQAVWGSQIPPSLRSCMSLPLKTDGGVFGVVAIYAPDRGGFRPDEEALFDELAADLSYGISALRERLRREEAERQMHHVQRLDALGKLASGIAHDFNNLLGAMLGFTRFIAEDTEPGTSLHHYAERALSAGQRGKALVERILAFARHGDAARRKVSLNDLVTETQALLAGILPATTRLVVEPAETCDPIVEGDPDQLTQILLNLCINAHDALGRRPGAVTLRASPSRFDGEVLARLTRRQRASAGWVETWQDADRTVHAVTGGIDPARPCVSLIVADGGCGMDLELIERIFTPFFTTKGRSAGTGLGLAVVQGIVLAHGGALAVTSRLREGTTFEIALPSAAEEAAVAAAELHEPSGPHRERQGLRVVLVDDDPHFGEMLATALERAGFGLTKFTDPLVALAHIRDPSAAFDVLVTDQGMPDMTGLALITELAALRPDVPCLLCTGNALGLDDETIGTGQFTLLPKPIDVGELTGLVGEAARRRKDAAS